MKVLVTGGDGQVSREIVKLGAHEDLQIDGTSKADLDITLLENLEAYIDKSKPELIVNAAAYTAVNQAEKEQELCFSVNKSGLSNLANICQRL